eukprot:gene29521-36587_t
MPLPRCAHQCDRASRPSKCSGSSQTSDDIERACTILKGSDQLPRRRLSSGGSAASREDTNTNNTNHTVQETSVPPPDLSAHSLSVLPSHVVLARLSSTYSADEEGRAGVHALCSQEVMRMLLFDERFSSLERHLTRNSSDLHNNTQQTSNGARHDNDKQKGCTSFLWGAWQCDGEVTLLLDESDLPRFPPDSLDLSPQKWRCIKLTGPAIPFSTTGVVSLMNRIGEGIPSLNISTASTNYTLVPEETLGESVRSLQRAIRGGGEAAEYFLLRHAVVVVVVDNI